jgi:hypothetical protein
VGRQELNNHLLKLHNVPVPKKTKVYVVRDGRSQVDSQVHVDDFTDVIYSENSLNRPVWGPMKNDQFRGVASFVRLHLQNVQQGLKKSVDIQGKSIF